MSIPKLAIALDYLDDDLIEEAEQKPATKAVWIRWAAIAACICIICGAGMLFAIGGENDIPDLPKEDDRGSATTVVSEDYTVDNSFENLEDGTMAEFGRDFLEMLFRAMDLDEEYELSGYIELELLKKYTAAIIGQEKYTRELYSVPSKEDYTLEITLAGVTKLEDCYRLSYLVQTEWKYPDSVIRFDRNDGSHILIKEKNVGYEIVGLQHTVKNAPYIGEILESEKESEYKGNLIHDPDFWLGASEEEMNECFAVAKEKIAEQKKDYTKVEADASGRTLITVEEGIPNEKIRELLSRYNRYLEYTRKNGAVEIDLTDEYIHEGVSYYRVLNEEIDEWDEFEALVDSIFDRLYILTETENDEVINVGGLTYHRYTDGSNSDGQPEYLSHYYEIGHGNAEIITYKITLKYGFYRQYHSTYFHMAEQKDGEWRIQSYSQSIS